MARRASAKIDNKKKKSGTCDDCLLWNWSWKLKSLKSGGWWGEGQGSDTKDCCWWDRAGWGPPAVNRWALLLAGGRRLLGTHRDGNAPFLAVHGSFCSPSKVTSSSAGQLRRRKRRRKRLHQDSTKGHEERGNSASPYYMRKEGWPSWVIVI